MLIYSQDSEPVGSVNPAVSITVSIILVTLLAISLFPEVKGALTVAGKTKNKDELQLQKTPQGLGISFILLRPPSQAKPAPSALTPGPLVQAGLMWR